MFIRYDGSISLFAFGYYYYVIVLQTVLAKSNENIQSSILFSFIDHLLSTLYFYMIEFYRYNPEQPKPLSSVHAISYELMYVESLHVY